MMGKHAIALSVLILFILTLFVPISAEASSISLSNTFSSTVKQDEIELFINSTNLGDEPAFNVRYQAEIMGQFKTSDAFERMEENSTVSWNERFLLGNVAPGAYPLFIKTSYIDSNGYSFSNVGGQIIRYKTDSIAAASASAEDVKLSSSAYAKVTVENLDSEAKSARIYFFLPNELSAQEKYLTLKADEKKEIKIKIINKAALAGSSYLIYSVIEYVGKTGNFSSINPFSIIITEPKKAAHVNYAYVISAAFFLAFIALNAVIIISKIKRHSRKKKPNTEINLKINAWFENAFNIAALLAAVVFLCFYFTPELMLSRTTSAGGDTQSHYATVYYLSNFMKTFRVSGWLPGNYAGFPLLHFYFPFPFMIMAVLGLATGPEIAFKLGSVLGTFLLPFAVFFLFKKMKFSFPVPAIAAIFSLSFLCIETNSMWGGNIPSTLAGEFCYSLALSIALFFLGALYENSSKEKPDIVFPSFLLFLVAISHVYALLFAGLTSLFFIFKKKGFGKNTLFILPIFIVAFLLSCFWLVPFVARMNLTTSYKDAWQIGSFYNLVPKSTIPFAALFLLSIFFIIFSSRRKEIIQDSRPYFFIFSIGVCVFLFFIAVTLGFINIRFIPFIQLLLILLGAYGLSLVFNAIKGKFSFPALLAAAIIIFSLAWTAGHVAYFPQWISWNYKGIEAKEYYPTFEGINTFLRDEGKESRVVYEHNEINGRFGSVRAFESLYYYTGRPTLEGLYLQASLNAPEIFYLQSLYSQQISCPFLNFGCSRLNFSRAEPRLQMFNVGEIIAVSPEAKAQINKTENFSFEKKFGEYEIYSLPEKGGYVSIPKNMPLFFMTKSPELVSYLWFINDSLIDTPLVFEIPDEQKNIVEASDLKDVLSVPITEKCKISESISDERIEFNTSCPGLPHIISISYFPNWKVQGAKKVYRVSPAFMLVYPEGNHVVLEYKKTSAEFFGSALTISGIAICALLLFFKRSPKAKKRMRLFQAKAEHFLDGHRILIFIIAIAAALAFVALLKLSDGAEREALITEIAVKTKSFTSCKYAGSQEENCYAEVSKVAFDYNLCTVKIREQQKKDQCYYNVAVYNKRNESCSLIKSDELKAKCFIQAI